MQRLITDKIQFWQAERQSSAQAYGKFSRMTERASAMIASLKLLRDSLTHEASSFEEAVQITKTSPEFLLLPSYWDRCKMLDELMEAQPEGRNHMDQAA